MHLYNYNLISGIEDLAQSVSSYINGLDISSTIPNYTELPDVAENEGKIVASGCDLYFSCNNNWQKIGSEGGAGVGGGESSSANVVFESNINSMIGTLDAFVNVPHVPTIDAYSAWDSSNHVWVAPKNMTVLVNCNHQAHNDHQHLFGQIRIGTIVKAVQGSTKNSVNTSDSSINLSAVIEVEAGDEISSLVSVQGAGSSVNLNDQIMTITELGGGGNSIIPSGSILQKALKEGAGISSTTLNQEIVSIDFTPKASDSILECEISFHWGDRGSNSLQQGSFFVDGVQVPGDFWYNNIKTPSNNARINTHHRIYLAAENTNSRTISNRITLQQNGPSAIGAPRISVTEIAQSDYTLAGGGGGGSSSATTTFEALTDTPVDYVNHSGKYLVVNDGEDGVGFTGIEKIAADLTDYGFLDGIGGGGSSNLYQTYLDSDSTVQVYRKENTSMPPKSLVTVFDYSDNVPIYIYGGNFQTSFAHNPKITVDGVLLNNSYGLIVGQDEDDSDISVITIPPIYAVSSVKIEWYNDSAFTQEFGGLLYYATGDDIQTVRGGGSSGGAFESLPLRDTHPSTDSIPFAIPDAVIAKNTIGNEMILSLEVITENPTDLANNRNLVYTAYGTTYQIDFTNDAEGSYLRSIDIQTAYQQNLKWFIDNDLALYYGGGGSSSATTTFDALTDTPVDYVNHSGKYLVVTDGEDGVGFTGIEKIAADLTDYGFLDGVGGGGGSSNIIFEASLSEMSNVPTSFTTASHIPYTPTIDTYSAWDTSINSWVAPKDMQVIATSVHLITDANSNVFANIHGDINYAYQSNVKDTQTPTHSYLNCAAIINLRAGEELKNRIIMQGGGNTTSIQRFLIAELGGGSSSSTINTIQENIDNIPLIGSGVQIPDAILIKDIDATTTNGDDNLIQLDYHGWSKSYDANGDITSNHFAYETNNGVGTRWYIRFDVEDGAYISHSEDRNVKKEFNSIQEYISNDRALYFGGGNGGGSSSATTTFDALTDTPVDYVNHSGDYLVVTDGEDGVGFTGIEKIAADLTDYGFSTTTTFDALTDTPVDYVNNSGKYVVVNDTEDGLRFVPAGDLLALGSLEGYDNCSNLHLQSNTINNSSTFQDLSINNFSIGALNAKHSTTTTPIYGSSSILFDNDGYLSIGVASDFAVLSSKFISNFTIQAYIKPVLFDGSTMPILGNAGQITDHGFRLYINGNNKLVFDVCKGLASQTSVTVISSQSIIQNEWQHIALVNENNTLTLYINGSDVGSTAWTEDGTSIVPQIPLQIGALPIGNNSSLNYFNGYMQDIRIDRAAFNSQYFPPTELTNSICNPPTLDIGFTSLKDTPINYTNAAGKYVRVSSNESELEFVGLSIAGSTNNQFSNSFLTNDITSDQVISEFNFGGLIPGKTYRISSTICFNADNPSDFPKVDFYNEDRKMFSLFSKGSTSTNSNSMLFIARGNEVYASGRDLSNSAYIMGQDEISFAQLELPPSVVVDLEEEEIPPVSQPGEGIFSISSINVFTNVNNSEDFETFTGILIDQAGGAINKYFDISEVNVLTSITDFEQEENLNVILPFNDFDSFKVTTLKALFNVQPYSKEENLSDIHPLFSVLNLGSLYMTANLQHSSDSEDKTSTFPHPNYP